MKLKYYLLGGLITLLGVVNITNAESITINGSNNSKTYTPSTITIPQGEFQGLSNKVCSEGECMIFITEGPATNEGNDACYVFISGESVGGEIEGVPYSCQAGQTYYVNLPYDFVYDQNVFDSITFNFEDTNTGGGAGGGTEGEGGNEGENTGSNIVAGGVNAFSGIIERLSNIFGEFGPYIIYIAIACIGISLLFKALKYILGFTSNQSKNSITGRAGMKERRRRRRQQRRKTYTFNQARNDNGKSYYYGKPYSKKLYKRSRKTRNGYIKNNGGF